MLYVFTLILCVRKCFLKSNVFIFVVYVICTIYPNLNRLIGYVNNIFKQLYILNMKTAIFLLPNFIQHLQIQIQYFLFNYFITIYSYRAIRSIVSARQLRLSQTPARRKCVKHYNGLHCFNKKNFSKQVALVQIFTKHKKKKNWATQTKVN